MPHFCQPLGQPDNTCEKPPSRQRGAEKGLDHVGMLQERDANAKKTHAICNKPTPQPSRKLPPCGTTPPSEVTGYVDPEYMLKTIFMCLNAVHYDVKAKFDQSVIMQ